MSCSRDGTRWVKKQRLFVDGKVYFILYINKSADEVQALEFIPLKDQEYATNQLVEEVIRKHIKS